ncbi:hypothetical protein [Bradyrhizobium guangdongense]
MDKQSFLNLAPEYYMLALYVYTQQPEEYYTDIGWQNDFSVPDEEAGEDYCYVGNDVLRAEAIRLMLEQGAISIIEDHFGPTIWQKTDAMESMANTLESSPGNVFFKARASGNPRRWLYAALQKVNVEAFKHSLTEADFHRAEIDEFTPEAVAEVIEPDVDEWAPITLDQTNPVVAEATKQLSAATQAIEEDNGYSVTHPQERDAVVADLKGGLEKLKSGVVSVGWMTRTITALKTAGVRFANTVKGQAVDGALAAIKEVVKSHMSHALDYLWSLLS